MKIEFSPAVELALNKAVAIAQHAKAEQIRPIDLLHALLDEAEGQPTVLLQDAGVGVEQLRGLRPVLETACEVENSLPLSPVAANVLAQARELARLHAAEGSISSDHLLLAIVEGDTAARTLLDGMGLDFEMLKNKITPPAPPLLLDVPFDFTPAPQNMDIARILDASANRAREALRVLEDFARFVRADAFLSAQFKNLRHQLAEAIEQLPADLLYHAHDTVHDVGTTITTAREQQRDSAADVAQVNSKRLQEALRSLEEFGKVLEPAFGAAIEQVRYQSYTLERSLLAGGDALRRLAQAKLYVLVSQASCKASLVGTVREALAGGAQIIQLREKSAPDSALLEMARDLRKMTRQAGALFIINDRPDIALLTEADGVHVGQDDLPVQQVRRLLGPEALIGVSTHDMEQVRRAVLEGASYLGVGPTFPSKTKDFAAFPGLDFVRQVAAETALAAFVLGGVTLDNVGEVLAAGGTRVAVSHALCAADEPQAVARKMRALLDAQD